MSTINLRYITEIVETNPGVFTISQMEDWYDQTRFTLYSSDYVQKLHSEIEALKIRLADLGQSFPGEPPGWIK